MLRLVAVFASGLVFALGLGIAGMTLPQKVLAFLDVAGDWDPSLGLVMLTSAGVYLALHRLVLRRTRPLFDPRFHLPSRSDIDQPLVAGAALFGTGWGLVGLCPAPALSALVTGQTKALIFFLAMAVGMYAHGTLQVLNAIRTESGAPVDG
jgi:uncharacterized membrane protein YedE/YeeE